MDGALLHLENGELAVGRVGRRATRGRGTSSSTDRPAAGVYVRAPIGTGRTGPDRGNDGRCGRLFQRELDRLAFVGRADPTVGMRTSVSASAEVDKNVARLHGVATAQPGRD